ncbi:MAG: 4-alpha-glucanotransferase [bacterium]|nr:4-alpha-glucanotransferase [bacterium]
MTIPSATFTPADDYQKALDRAAAAWGIDPGYWDIWGSWHVTTPHVQREILTAMGVGAQTLDGLNRALEERLWKEWNSLAPKVLVVSENADPAEVSLRLPMALEDRALRVELEWEDGWRGAVEHQLTELETARTAELRGQRFVEKRLPLTASPLGYHNLRLSVAPNGPASLNSQTRLIVTPDRAYLPSELEQNGRRAGLNVSLYGVRSARNWGCGDFTDLDQLASWVGRKVRGSFLALNPLHAIPNRQPFNTSPYLPTSIFYRNPIYLDVERIEDLAGSTWARALLDQSSVQAEIQALNSSEFVEYERVYRLKKVFLKLAFRAFGAHLRDDTPRARAFRAYVEAEGDLLHRFAVYSALDEWLHAKDPNLWTWDNWPPQFRDPDSEAVGSFASHHHRAVLFYKYVQWQVELQLSAAQQAARDNGLSIGLFHDVALATDRCGGDLWAHRRFFVSDCRVGAPPDDFSPQGQDWSFPPPASETHWEDGYQLFRESIRHCCAHGGALRIDHVMRFFRLFWIPAGREATEGTYVRDRHEDLVRILALESVRNKVLVIGEDLGTVEPGVRDILARFGILSYRLFYFERDQSGALHPPGDYPAQALVSSTTHDLPTLAGFWAGRDIESRRETGVLPDAEACRRAYAQRDEEKQAMLDALHSAGLLPDWVSRSAKDLKELTGELHNAVTGFLASTPSMLLALNQEDLTKETEQQNLPGTTHQYPNWRRKMRYTIEELETSEEVNNFAGMFRNWLDQSGRVDSGE